jgi:hypothetical protein
MKSFRYRDVIIFFFTKNHIYSINSRTGSVLRVDNARYASIIQID